MSIRVRLVIYKWLCYVLALVAALAVFVAANGYRDGWRDGGNAGYAACKNELFHKNSLQFPE